MHHGLTGLGLTCRYAAMALLFKAYRLTRCFIRVEHVRHTDLSHNDRKLMPP